MKHSNSPILLNSIKIIYLILFLSFFSVCSKKSEKDQILEMISSIASSAEKRDLDGLFMFISDDYSDDEERTADDLKDLAEDYFNRYHGIVVKILKTNIIEIKTPEATIETDISLSSGAAKLLRKFVRISSASYRFKMLLKKDIDQWKIYKLSWRYIPTGGIFTGYD